MKKTETDVIKTMPMFMIIFVTSASILGAFNIISPQLMSDYNIGFSTVSLLSMVGILVIGLASVIYSTLSDNISIRKLMLMGIGLFNVGALLALVTSYFNFYIFVVAVAIMVLGGTCGSGLMIVTATRYLAEDKHAKYYGFNAACVGISQLVGILAGGFIATYISWRLLFLLPFISLFTIPTIKKYIPDEKGTSNHKIDFIGLGIFTCFALFISLFFIVSKIVILLIAFVLLVFFFLYIARNEMAFINIEFFKNKKFVMINGLALIVFGLQSAFSFMFPFMAQGIYSLTLDKVSMLLIPSFVCAILVGANSGKIVEKLGSYKTLILAIFLSICATLLAVVMIDQGLTMLSISSALYAAAFALMYSPFMKMLTNSLEITQVGVGIGFFNLMTGIGPSLLIAITGKLLTMTQLTKSIGLVGSEATIFSNILLLYAGLLIVSIIVLRICKTSFVNKQPLGGK